MIVTTSRCSSTAACSQCSQTRSAPSAPAASHTPRCHVCQERLQQEAGAPHLPAPLAGLSSLGRRVAGGFSQLSSASSKVSQVIFPWLGEAEEASEARVHTHPAAADILSEADTAAAASAVHYEHYDPAAGLPLLPPLFIPPPPPPPPQQPAALATDTVYHRSPAPQPSSQSREARALTTSLSLALHVAYIIVTLKVKMCILKSIHWNWNSLVVKVRASRRP